MTGRFLLGLISLAALLSGPGQRAWADAAGPPAPAPPPPGVHAQDATIEQYRQHLQALDSLVQACAKARDSKSCDPAQVGPDDSVPLGSAAGANHRLVRFGWLRVLISQAQDKDAAPEKPAPEVAHLGPAKTSVESVRPPKPSTTQLLQAAHTRLAQDIAKAGTAPALPPAHDRAQAVMKQVLAEREFRNLEEPTARDSVLEKFGNWLNHLFENAATLSARAVWLGRAVVGGFILVVCVGLVWGLIQLERRWRIRLVPGDLPPAPGAASARDWQLWLDDARRAAAAGLWREAIHFVYWASISRLESRRLWPADRARTPREYLALVPAGDARKPALATLTGSFERIWYGGRAAGQPDYLRAEQIASALIDGSASQATNASIPASEGGAAR